MPTKLFVPIIAQCVERRLCRCPVTGCLVRSLLVSVPGIFVRTICFSAVWGGSSGKWEANGAVLRTLE